MTLSNSDRDAVEELASEFTERLRHGERPDPEEYVSRCPERAAEIRELFPTIDMMERVKGQRTRSSDGRASLGASRPEKLGDYRILREIGRGGMGVVYEAEQESLGRNVAVKILPRQAIHDPEQLERFRQEARTVARLHHTNIVPIFGVGEQDGFHYYVMQLIPGVGLDEVLRWLASTTARQGQNSPSGARMENISPRPRFGGEGSGVRGFVDVPIPLTPNPSPPSTGERGDSLPPLTLRDGPESRGEARHDLITRVAQALVRGHRPEISPSDAPAPMVLCLGPTYWRQVAQVGTHIAEALQAAHSQGVLHRDVKPANLLLNPEGHVWVGDFGLARALETDDAATSGDLVGTLAYMAPEVFDGRGDHRGDIYSLGLTLYEMLTLRPAYRSRDREDLIRRITAGEMTPLRKQEPAIPRDLEAIVLKATAHDPAQRYNSAGELADDLRRFLAGFPIHARRASPVRRWWLWKRRNPAVAALAGAVLTLLVVLTAVSTTAYFRTRNALQGESRERVRAEATAVLSLEALDRTFAQFAPRQAGTPAAVMLEGSAGEVIEVNVQPVLSKETAAFLQEMLKYYDRLAQQSGGNAALRRAAARANLRVGDIHQRLGHYDAALTAYPKAISLYRSLAAGATDITSRTEIALAYNELGNVQRALRQPEEARQAHQQAIALLAADASIAGSPEASFELARTYYLLARHYRLDPPPGPPPPGPPGARGKRPPPLEPPPDRPGKRRGEQLALLRKAVELLSELEERYPSAAAYRHLLACCLRESSSGVTSPEKERALTILEALCRDFPDVPEYLHDLCETYANFDTRRPPVDAELDRVAEGQLRKALAAVERLISKHPNIPDYVTSHAHIRHKLGSILRRLDQRQEAEQHYRQAVDLQLGLVREFGEVKMYHVWLATFRGSLAEFLLTSGKLTEARDLQEAAVADLEAVLQENPDAEYIHPSLAQSYSRLARVCGALGNRTREAQALRQAETHRTAFRVPNPDR